MSNPAGDSGDEDRDNVVPDVNEGGDRAPGRRRRNRKIPSELRLQVAGNGRAVGSDDGGAATVAGTIASRPTYTEVQLEQTYRSRMEPEEQKAHIQTLMEERRAGKEAKGKRAIALGIVTKIFPCVRMLLNYDVREYGAYDLLSGISVGLFLIPQSIAYSLLANVRPQYGFYSAFFAMIIYFFLGSSHHMNLTNQGAVSLLVGEAVRSGIEQVYPGGVGLCAAVTANGTADANATTVAMTTVASVNASSNSTSLSCISRDEANIQIAITVTMIAGALQLALGFMRFGFLTIYLSDPINKAFTCAAALHIVSSQLGNLLGAPIPTFGGNGKFFLYIIEAIKMMLANRVNVPTAVVSVFFLAILLGAKIFSERCIKRIKMPIPIDIVVLIAGLLLSKFLYWQDTLKITSVGPISKGFEAPRVPPVSHFTSGSGIIVNGIVLGIIAYSMSVALSKNFALRNGYEIDPNQEMLAYGAASFISCWFGTFVAAAAIACTSLHESLKGRTQVNTLYATLITLLAILVLAPEFAPVPKCVLSAIIVANMKNMILQLEQLPTLWRTNKYDFTVFLVTLAAILGLDMPIGLLIGVGFSLATVIFRTQAPKAYLLGRLPNTDIYRNIKKHKKAEQIPGVKIFKFDGAVYFASAENYRNTLYRQVGMNPKKILIKAKARARKEGRPYGDMDLRTDFLRSEGIRKILETVAEEGSHPTAEGRMAAQETLPEQKTHTSFESMAYRSDNEEVVSTVNVFCIILDLSACAFTDAVGIRLLSQIVDEFSKIGVEIYLSGCTWLVRSQLRKANFYAKRSENGLFVTIHDAVIHALSTFYKELLEDETMRSEAQARLESPRTSEAANGIPTDADSDESHAATKPKSRSAGERARDQRRRIRKESWRKNSLGTGPVSPQHLAHLHAISLTAVSSLPTLAESAGAFAKEGSRSPVLSDRGAGGAVRFSVRPDSPDGAPPTQRSAGLDNAGFEIDTKF